ncbi:hypothetical protein PAXRUDRAFT_597166 [Paxillus rubicundulus Ve08.2h10]|uniref:Uncharacterized protein n=1 Tax=Paxillus rubicundulus Ve08.2h10 TaxID=930991 RepID=A0A0D0DLB2_9AGAM|nr:hypothetical protein PAXRUDRAFT_597166 [Paxillus rubicundulus Ve08.2h10]
MAKSSPFLLSPNTASLVLLVNWSSFSNFSAQLCLEPDLCRGRYVQSDSPCGL